MASSVPAAPAHVREVFASTQALEKQLKGLLKQHPQDGCFSSEALRLQDAIRGGYEQVILRAPEFAASRDVELAMWKSCFYRRIEEYRKRIRKQAQQASLSNATASQLATSKDYLHRLCQAFNKLLQEAMTFYETLLSRLVEMLQARKPDGAGGGAQVCLHRCYIFMGDLARYRELHSEQSAKDFRCAEQHYQDALRILPDQGNPHNQLAVLATYSDAECVAVYCYCRSLLSASPFMTSRENLSLLFEKNRQRMLEQPALASTPPTGSGRDKAKGGGAGGGNRSGTGVLLKSFLRRFVRLHAVLLTAEDGAAHEFAQIFDGAVGDFRSLVGYSAFGDALLVKMIAICISTVVITAEPCPAASDNSRALSPTDRWTILHCALSVAFAVAAEIGRHVRTTDPSSNQASTAEVCGSSHAQASGPPPSSSSSVDSSKRAARNQPQPRPLGSRLLGPVVLFCDWLRSTPRYVNFQNDGFCCDVQVLKREQLMRLQFWEIVCHLTHSLPLPDPTVMNAQSAGLDCALREHLELRGFTPLEMAYRSKYDCVDDGRCPESVPDERAAMIRIAGLRVFAEDACLSKGAGAAAPPLRRSADGMFSVSSPESSAIPAPRAGELPNSGHWQASTPGTTAGSGGGLKSTEELDDLIMFKSPVFARHNSNGGGGSSIADSGGWVSASSLPASIAPPSADAPPSVLFGPNPWGTAFQPGADISNGSGTQGADSVFNVPGAAGTIGFLAQPQQLQPNSQSFQPPATSQSEILSGGWHNHSGAPGTFVSHQSFSHPPPPHHHLMGSMQPFPSQQIHSHHMSLGGAPRTFGPQVSGPDANLVWAHPPGAKRSQDGAQAQDWTTFH
jgi:hypothetical protein